MHITDTPLSRPRFPSPNWYETHRLIGARAWITVLAVRAAEIRLTAQGTFAPQPSYAAIWTWIQLTSIAGGMVLSVLAGLAVLPWVVVDAVKGVVLTVGLLLTCVGGMTMVVLRGFVGPQGDLKTIEGSPGEAQQVVILRHVHPGFVAAVIESNANPT